MTDTTTTTRASATGRGFNVVRGQALRTDAVRQLSALSLCLACNLNRVQADGLHVPAQGVSGVNLTKVSNRETAHSTAFIHISEVSTMSKANSNTANTAANTANTVAASASAEHITAVEKVGLNAYQNATRAAAKLPAFVRDVLSLNGAAVLFTHRHISPKGRAFTADGDVIAAYVDVSGVKNASFYILYTVDASGEIDAAVTDRAAYKLASERDGVLNIALVDTVQNLLDAGRLPSKSKVCQLASRAKLLGVSVPVDADGKLDRATLGMWDAKQIQSLVSDIETVCKPDTQAAVQAHATNIRTRPSARPKA